MRQQERELESLEKQAEELHEKQAQAHLLSLLSPCDGGSVRAFCFSWSIVVSARFDCCLEKLW